MEWLNERSREFLSRGYLVNQSAEERLHDIAQRAEQILKIDGFAKKFYSYLEKGFYSLSTPVWCNFGLTRGLPISCFGSNISDEMSSILYAQAEVGMMTKYGGGTSAFFGNLRPRGAAIRDNGFSSGSVHFMQLFETIANITSQGSARRGNFAAYLPIEHPDIHEFLNIRSEGNPLQTISFGVTVSDAWMSSMIAGDQDKRATWARLIETRINTGYPYIVFIDNMNNNAPDFYKGKITSSNLCSEIALPLEADESFVCDLSSMNVMKFDEWKDTDAVETLTYFLDAVMTEFIEKARGLPFFARAVKFAERHRALGIGLVGYHSYLQSKNIPFESVSARLINKRVTKLIRDCSYNASIELGLRYGTAVASNHTRRNTTTMAVAPTKSSAFILGQISEGIEPHRTNYYIKDLQKGKYTIKNSQLEALLESYGANTPEVWESIMFHEGSVQHLDMLTDHDKLVFKTFNEISPMEIITQAAERQKYIDQSQSLNLMIHPATPVRDINALYIEAWRLGVKSLYYQIGINSAQQFSRDILNCVVCEA